MREYFFFLIGEGASVEIDIWKEEEEIIRQLAEAVKDTECRT